MRKLAYSVALLVLAAMVFTQIAAKAKLPDLAIGKAVPDFTLEDQNGKTVHLADLKNKIVVLEWFNESCPFVKKHYIKGDMNAVAGKYVGDDVVWLAINSTKTATNESNAKAAKAWSMDRPILNDATGATGKAYGAKNTPQMYIINKDQTLAYRGAIDSKSSADAGDIAGATNYVAKALDELKAGKPVSEPETKPYGCSVKYAD